MTPATVASGLLLTDLLALHARHRGADAAVIDGEGVHTYADLWSRAELVRRRVQARGIGLGDRVAIAADGSTAHLAAILGVLRAGAVAAPVNTRLTDAELATYVAAVDADIVLVGGAHAERFPGRETADLLAMAGPDADDGLVPDPPQLDEAMPAAAFPTGGTTGTPKAALWTHRGLSLAVASSVAVLRVHSGDRETYISPFFHVTLIPGVLATLHAGGVVHVHPRFDAAAAAAGLAEGWTTRLFATPTAMQRVLVELGARRPLPDVRAKLAYGASRSGDAFLAELRSSFPNAELFTGYGATEFGAVVRCLPEDLRGDADRGVGRPVPGVLVRIVDELGRDVAPGEEGEIAVASPWQMVGYLGVTEGEPRRLDDGSLLSGDVGWFDDDGYLHLRGRRKDTIKSAGETVFPAEVEEVLLLHPAVEDAAVVGVPDAEWGERVDAFVVLGRGERPPPEELTAHCRRLLAGFKVPKRVRVVDALPYTPNQKLDRRAVLELQVADDARP